MTVILSGGAFPAYLGKSPKERGADSRGAGHALPHCSQDAALPDHSHLHQDGARQLGRAQALKQSEVFNQMKNKGVFKELMEVLKSPRSEVLH